jgi:hypothetical protein
MQSIEMPSPSSATPLVIDAISVFEQPDRDAPFTLRGRYPFGA